MSVPADLLALDAGWDKRNLLSASSQMRSNHGQAHGYRSARGPEWKGVLAFGRDTSEKVWHLESLTMLVNQMLLHDRFPNRPWLKVVIPGAMEPGGLPPVVPIEITSAAEARELYELWMAEELREHAFEAAVSKMWIAAYHDAYRLTAEADALPEDSPERASKVAEYVERTEAMYRLCTREMLDAWHDDPNLLVSVVGNPETHNLALSGTVTRSLQGAKNQLFSFIIQSNGAGRIRLRNVTRDFALVEDRRATPTFEDVDGTNPDQLTSHAIRLPVTAAAGRYLAVYDLRGPGADPLAELEVAFDVPEPPAAPEPEADED